MAQQQTNINLAAVGFNGLNTEDSPITQDYSYAKIADNAVINNEGRIGSRKAFSEDTTTLPSFTTMPGAVSYKLVIDTVKAATIAFSNKVLCTATYTGYDANGGEVDVDYYVLERQNALLSIVTYPALSDPSKLADADIIATDDRFYIFVEGEETMVWTGTGAATLISAQTPYIGIQNTPSGAEVAPEFSHGIAAYGRVWATGHLGDMNTIYYSDLLIGASNYTVDGIDPLSTAGKLNVLEAWPTGKDQIVSIAAHNNRLIIFGTNAILVYNAGYGDPADPASGFTLEDTITGKGCVSRDATTSIGSDILYVDTTGVLSLGRTIQERSSPMGELTAKIRKDVGQAIRNTAVKSSIKLEYVPGENFVLCLFGGERLAYCLDLKVYATEGFAKITRWTNCDWKCMEAFEGGPVDATLLMGSTTGYGLVRYEGYASVDGSDYMFRYYSNRLNFGQPARTKFLKQIDFTVVTEAADQTGFGKWVYDDSNVYKSKSVFLDAVEPSYYNQGEEYEVAKFGYSEGTTKRYKINTNGSGENAGIGLEVPIYGNGVAIHEINIQTLIGRIR